MKRKPLFLILAGISAVLFAVSLVVLSYANVGTDILEPTGFSTGLQNNCLGYDEQNGITLVGTYNNCLIAFDQQENQLWKMEAKGPFRQLVVHSDTRTIYAGNEDNHVYLVDLDTGALKGDINTQRRIYSIDVTDDGSEILVSAGTGTNKHNIMLYTSEGEQKENLQYKIRYQGATFTPKQDAILMGNNRGEVKKIDLAGNELASIKLKYELVGLRPLGKTDNFLALCGDGSFTILDENLAILGSGVPKESFAVKGRSVGADSEGKYIAVGTVEGFLYLFDNSGEQIYTTRLPNTITDFLPLDNTIRMTGLGDFLYSFSVDRLEIVRTLGAIMPVIQVAEILTAVLAIVFLLLGFGRTRSFLYTLGRTLKKHRVAYLLLIPTFVLLILFNYTPVVMALTRAFTNWSKTNNTWATIQFIGLDNFRLMISEGYFLTGLSNLFLLMVTGFIKVLTVPLLVAWLVYSMAGNRKKYVFRFLFVLPMVVPSVVTALLWKQIYDPTIGLLNQVLGRIGLENLQRVWLGDESTAMWAIIFMGFPFVNALAFLVYYGGLTDIDISLLESARIDGAGRPRIFSRIQLPMILPQLKIILILTFIGVIQEFSSIYLLTTGGPGSSTYVPGLELYLNATKFGRYGYACALGLVMFIFTLIGSILNMKMKTDTN